MSLFDFMTSREIVAHKISTSSEKRGYKTSLAKIMNVTPSFLSQLMSGDAQLSPDHACLLCDLWVLDQRQSEYFIELVNYERATSPALKTRLAAKLEKLRLGWQPIGDHQIKKDDVAIKNFLKYYVSWKPTAVATACNIPEIRTIAAVAKRLNITELEVGEILDLLDEIGLIKRDGDTWLASGEILGRSSEYRELNYLFHQSVRDRAFDDLALNVDPGIHGTLCFGLSRKAYAEIKQMIIAFTQDISNVVIPSPSEEVAFFAIDFFRINGN
jgi:uncharacterized protein (TIGR02147 family)